jgi:hypothetical protein
MLKWLFKFVVTTKFWDWFLSHPMAHFKMRLIDYPSFPMSKYHDIVKIMEERPGFYVFVGTDKASFSIKVNHLASGAEWAHAGIVLPGTNPPQILHSIVTGVCTWDLLDYLREVDNFALIKITPKDEVAAAEVTNRLEWMLQHAIGMPYDNGFDLGNRKAFYCSELVYTVFEGQVNDPNFNPELIAEMPFFTPDDTAQCGEIALRWVKGA